MATRLEYQGGRLEKQEICPRQIISTMLKDGQVTGLRDAFQWCVMVEWPLKRLGVAGSGLFSVLLPGFVFPRLPRPRID
jgi:hypothetical protein